VPLRPVYSTQFIRANDSDVYYYTCPEGYVALVSCVDCYIGIVTEGGNFTGYSGDADEESSPIFWSQGYDVPGEQYSAWRGKIILTAGGALAFTAGGTFACNVSGDLLTVP
jgi:hypothetical protein